MEEKGKNPSLGFSVQPGGEGRAVKLKAYRSRVACWEQQASKSQVESRPDLGDQGSGQAGAQRCLDQPWGWGHHSTVGT